MKRLKRVFGSVKNLTKDEFGGSTSSILSRLTNTKSIASKSSFESKNDLKQDGTYMAYDFQSSPLHGSHLIDYADPLNYSDHLSTKLHKYCFLGDVSKAKKCLKKININSQDSEGRTALHLAAAAGHLEVVLVLMGERVNPEIEDFDGRTSFLIAVERNQIEIVQIFLKYKVGTLAKDKYGNQAIHLAARSGAKDVIDLLIDSGLDFNAVNVLYQTPLHIATENLNLDVVKSLLTCPLNVNAIDKESVTALMLAAKIGSNPLIDCLIESGANLHLVDSSGWNAAAYAKYSMHEELEQKLNLIISSEVQQKQDEKSHSLDRLSRTHVRSISDTFDSWTESSIAESHKLKLTYFNVETENASSSKTLPRKIESNSSLGPPKPPRLYTSTPNLDMNEHDLEENISQANRSQHYSTKHSMNYKSSNDNTIRSDITFGNDDNSLLNLSMHSQEEISSSSTKHKESLSRQSDKIPFRSHSLSPKSSVNEVDRKDNSNITLSKLKVGNIYEECYKLNHSVGLSSEFSNKDNHSVGLSSEFSNKDRLNEEVWESNAHFSVGSNENVQTCSSSKKMKVAEKDDSNVQNNNFALNLMDSKDNSSSTSSKSDDIDISDLISPMEVDSTKKNDDKKYEESSLYLLLTSTTPSGREELQGLVRKLRSALNKVNVNSKAKDHSLATLKKSESFLKRQLKEIENRTCDLAEQNCDFMHRLENLQSKTSALKDEANSVCSSLEENGLSFSAKRNHVDEEICDSAKLNRFINNEKPEDNKCIFSTADIKYESSGKEISLEAIKNLQTDSGLREYTSKLLQSHNLVDHLLEATTLSVDESNTKQVETVEIAVQTDIVVYDAEAQTDIVVYDAEAQTDIVLYEAETQSGIGFYDVETQTDFNGSNLIQFCTGENITIKEEICKNERNCMEEKFQKFVNSAMEQWRTVIEETSAKLQISAVNTESSRDRLILEINERLDHLNERVPIYSNDVKAAVKCSLTFNEDLYTRINKIEKSCESISELSALPNILNVKNDQIQSLFSEINQIKLDLATTVARVETSLNNNRSMGEKHCANLDSKVTQHVKTVVDKIENMKCDFDLIQNALTQKVIMFNNVSDEIKELSCGMKRISDNYEASTDAVYRHSSVENENLEIKWKIMSAKLEDMRSVFESTLVKLKHESFTNSNSFSGLVNKNEETIHLLSEMSKTYLELNTKMGKILENQVSLSNQSQFGTFETMLFNNEKSVEDIKLNITSLYNLLNSLQLYKNTFSTDNEKVKCENDIKQDIPDNLFINDDTEQKCEQDLKPILNKINTFVQTDGECDLNHLIMQVSTLEDENRLLIAENQLNLKENSLNKSQLQSLSKSMSLTEQNEWMSAKIMMEEDLKSLQKLNTDLIAKLSNLETDCDELEEELDLKEKEMQNQKKINAIQKNEMKEMRQQIAIIPSLQSEKFSLEEHLIRLDHSELEYKQIIEHLRVKVLELTRENVRIHYMMNQTEIELGHQEDDSKMMESIGAGSSSKDDMESLVVDIDNHFQSAVTKKLKEINNMLEEKPLEDASLKNSVETYQEEMIKLRNQIISLKNEIDQVDCDKELWHARYDDLHERYQQLQRKQPFVRSTPVEEDTFEKVLDNIEEQLKVPYPVSKMVESGHPDSDYFSSLRYSPNSGPSSFESKPERTFISVLRQNCSPPVKEFNMSNKPGHTVIPLLPHAEKKSSIKGNDASSGSNLEQSCERYIDFLQVKHAV